VPLADGSIKLYHCPFQRLEEVAGIRPATVKTIVTDIPYDESFLTQAEELAAFAERVLVEGGLFVTYYGHVYLNKVIAVLDKYLTYRWTTAATWDGDANLVPFVQVCSKWSPILIYSKGKWTQRREYWPDVFRVNSKEKQWHDYQKPLEEVKRLLTYYSNRGDLVVDPCGGGFTTALACYHLGRRCISCDIDAQAVSKGLARLNKAMRGEPDCP
jgi:site-specific DNA-methyltransferase (adenine-specific)